MRYLCTECHSVINPTETRSDLKLGEKFLWAITILGIIVGLFNKIVLLLAFLWLGICVSISLILRNPKFFTCPKCNKKSLIPLNTPKAQELIKTHNLVVPEEPIETSKPKAPWQTS